MNPPFAPARSFRNPDDSRCASLGEKRATFWRWLPRLLLLAVAMHWAGGIWPCAPVEGDEQGVINGLEAWTRTPGLFPKTAYLYAIQPGSYWALRWLHVMLHVAYLPLLVAMSSAGAAWFATIATCIIAPLVKLKNCWVALCLLSAQELGAAACYANTSALAGAVVLTGLLIGLRRDSMGSAVVAGAVIAAGGWLRLDALLVTPVLLPALLAGQVPWRRAFLRTAVVAVVVLFLLLTLLRASGLGVTDSWKLYLTRPGSDWSLLLTRGWLALSLSWGLGGVAGLVLWLLRGQWLLLAVTVFGSLPSIAGYGGSLTTPKYLFYALPFLALPAVWSAAAASRSNGLLGRWLGRAWLLVLVGELFTGVRTSSAEYRRYEPGAFLVRLLACPWHNKTMEWGFGEGEVVPTDDGPRLRGGLWYSPAMWLREKDNSRAALVELDRQMNDRRIRRVVTSTYLSWQVVDGWLLRHAFGRVGRTSLVANPGSHTSIWRYDNRDIEVILVNHGRGERPQFEDVSREPQGLLFVNDRGKIGRVALGACLEDWRLLTVGENGCLSVYRHR